MPTLSEKLPSRVRAAGAALLDVVFPRWCVECGCPVEGGAMQHVCEACFREIIFAQPPHCSTCGWPFPGTMEGSRRCPSCVDLDPEFEEGRTGMLLRGAGRTLVHEMKYRGGWHLRGDLPALVRQMPMLRDFVRGAVLVPVPLHPKRLRWRGFNQAQWVAEALMAEGGAAGLANLLDRVRDTPTQTHLDRAARERNMANAFALKPGLTLPSANRYILVDDVFTTGATLNACAKVLRAGGADALDIASLGHG